MVLFQMIPTVSLWALPFTFYPLNFLHVLTPSRPLALICLLSLKDIKVLKGDFRIEGVQAFACLRVSLYTNREP